MSLHGIERVSDDYFAFQRDGECSSCGFREGSVCRLAKCPRQAEWYMVRVEGQACVIAGFEQLDLFLDHWIGDACWVVAEAMTGCYLADGASADQAIARAKRRLDDNGLDGYERAVIGRIEAGRLTPRYRWAGASHCDDRREGRVDEREAAGD